MGTEQEVLRLDYIVNGLDDIAALVAAQDKATASTDRLRDAQGKFAAAGSGGSSGKTVKQQAQDIYDFADAYEVLGEEMRGVFTTAQQVGLAQSAIANTRVATGITDAELRKTAGGLDEVGKAGTRAKGGVAGFGQSALQTGRVVQDFYQGGVLGILNNIEGLTMALGLGSGLAGVLTILGVGFSILKPQIMDFLGSLSATGVKEFVSQLDALNARIKELEDKPHKVTVDVMELEAAKAVVEQIKAALSEVDKLRKGQAHYEGESGKAIGEMIAEAPGGSQGVHQALRGALQPEMLDRATAPILAEMDAVRAKIADDLRAAANLDAAGQSGAAARLRGQAESRKGELGALDEKRLAAVNDVVKPNGALDQRIGQVLGTAKTGAGVAQADAQRTLAELLGKAGLGGLAEGVRSASPDQLLANDRADEDLDASIEAQKEGIKRRAEARKKAKDAKARAEAPVRVRVLGEAGAAAVGPAGAPKGKVDSDAARRDALIQRRANQIQDQSRFYTGQQFSPEQARHAAERSTALQARGLNANQATVQAMGEMLATMSGFGAKIAHLEQQVAGIRQNNNQLNRRAHQRQPSALNSGGFP